MAKNPHKALFYASIDKAKKHLDEKGVGNPSRSQLTEELADYISESIKGYSINERTLRNYWQEFEKNANYQIPQPLVLDGLSRYMEFEDYRDWLLNHHQKRPTAKKRSKPNKVLLGFSGGIFVIVLIWTVYTIMNKECWMQWKGDRYEEVGFDAKLLEQGVLKVCKEERLEEFRKVDNDTVSVYFDSNNNPLYWYGRNMDGELELFTTVGLHPITGKTLKPITQYMIDKYLSD